MALANEREPLREHGLARPANGICDFEPVKVHPAREPRRVERHRLRARRPHAVDEHGHLAPEHVVDGEPDRLRRRQREWEVVARSDDGFGYAAPRANLPSGVVSSAAVAMGICASLAFAKSSASLVPATKANTTVCVAPAARSKGPTPVTAARSAGSLRDLDLRRERFEELRVVARRRVELYPERPSPPSAATP